MKRIYFILAVFTIAVLFSAGCLSAQEQHVIYSYPNLTVPLPGEPGIRDTIYFPHDVIIDDANFYVGIDTYQFWAGQLNVSITSPWGHEVVLHNHNPFRNLECWFDTEEEEDGPGDLDDYVGHSAQGEWNMYVVRWLHAAPFYWVSWAIEIITSTPVDIDDDAPLPLVTALGANYPNPFNPSTSLRFSLANPGTVALDIYDITGRLVCSLFSGELQPGRYDLKWHGTNSSGDEVASGVYYCRMAAVESGETKSFTRKLMLLK